MSAKMTTIADIAGEAYGWFELAERDNGDNFRRLKDGAPEWITDLVREAHREGSGDLMFPDDWRYESIHDALGWVAGNDAADLDDSHEFADSNVDTYNGSRATWLSSHIARGGYCDDAIEEGLVNCDNGVYAILGAGQYLELQEIFGAVVESLRARLEELEG